MKFRNVSIVGLAHVDAPIRVTSDEIEDRLAPALKRLGVQKGVLAALSGITARRVWAPGVSFSDAATLAAERVLEKTGFDRRRLGVVISTSVCKDYIEPSMACLVHGNLELPAECMNMDLGNACLAFVNAMEIVGGMIERGQVDFGMIVDGEGSRYAVEKTIERLLADTADMTVFRENFATLTLGSGGAAMILGRSDMVPDRHELVGSVCLAATRHNRLCLGQSDGMVTDAGALLVAGVELARKTWRLAEKELGWQGDCLDHYFVHQVSAVHTAKFAETIGIDYGKVYKIFPEYGNVGPAAMPMSFAKALEDGLVEKGGRLGLLGIGSGLNCSMMEVRW